MNNLDEVPTTKGPKEIKIGIASILDLKTELAKKQAEYGSEKRHNGAIATAARLKDGPVRKNVQKAIKRNKGLEDRMARDSVQEFDISEESKLAASYSALERKAAIYNELSRGGGPDELIDNENVLVDFLARSYKAESDSSSGEQDKARPCKKKKKPNPNTNAEPSSKGDWVEIIDEFGRSRLIRSEEAEPLEISKQRIERQEKERVEMQEALRQEEENANFEGYPKNDTTYQAPKPKIVQYFDSTREKRNMGVGFYQFSQDEETRKHQFDNINDLRQETVETRNRVEIQKIKRAEKTEERKRKLQERARARKHVNAEKTADNFLSSLSSFNS